METKLKTVLNNYPASMSINGVHVVIGRVVNEMFVIWRDDKNVVHHIEDENIFILKDKVMNAFLLENDVHQEIDLLINFLYKALHLDYISNLHDKEIREQAKQYLASFARNKEDEKLVESIEKYMTRQIL